MLLHYSSVVSLSLSISERGRHESDDEQGAPTSLLSLACSSSTFTVAAGTELANSQASVLLTFTLEMRTYS